MIQVKKNSKAKQHWHDKQIWRIVVGTEERVWKHDKTKHGKERRYYQVFDAETSKKRNKNVEAQKRDDTMHRRTDRDKK